MHLQFRTLEASQRRIFRDRGDNTYLIYLQSVISSRTSSQRISPGKGCLLATLAISGLFWEFLPSHTYMFIVEKQCFSEGLTFGARRWILHYAITKFWFSCTSKLLHKEKCTQRVAGGYPGSCFHCYMPLLVRSQEQGIVDSHHQVTVALRVSSKHTYRLSLMSTLSID